MPDSAEHLAIDLHDVTKSFGKVLALRGIEMQVSRGEIFGLLGPNGAGKSTLVKIMMSIVRPTLAHGSVLGKPVGDKPTLARIGYLPEHHRFPRYLTGRQIVEFYAALGGVSRAARKKNAGELLELVGMSKWADTRIGTYSKGMQQRVGLAQAMASDPELVVLDEPTDGVDPAGRKEIRQVLLHLRERGKTIFVNSHLLSELEMMADRVAILVQGQVVRQGTIEQLTVASKHYEIELAGDSASVVAGANAAIAGIEKAQVVGNTIHLPTVDPAAVQPVIDQLRKRGLVLVAIRPVRQSLEDLYMEATTDSTGHVIGPGALRKGETPGRTG